MLDKPVLQTFTKIILLGFYKFEKGLPLRL